MNQFNQGPGEKPIGVNITKDMIDKCDDIVCKKCGGYHFMQLSSAKRLPAIISPSGKIGTFWTHKHVCALCGAEIDLTHTVKPKQKKIVGQGRKHQKTVKH